MYPPTPTETYIGPKSARLRVVVGVVIGPPLYTPNFAVAAAMGTAQLTIELLTVILGELSIFNDIFLFPAPVDLAFRSNSEPSIFQAIEKLDTSCDAVDP
jgi:hypothetical protein